MLGQQCRLEAPRLSAAARLPAPACTAAPMRHPPAAWHRSTKLPASPPPSCAARSSPRARLRRNGGPRWCSGCRRRWAASALSRPLAAAWRGCTCPAPTWTCPWRAGWPGGWPRRVLRCSAQGTLQGWGEATTVSAHGAWPTSGHKRGTQSTRRILWLIEARHLGAQRDGDDGACKCGRGFYNPTPPAALPQAAERQGAGWPC